MKRAFHSSIHRRGLLLALALAAAVCLRIQACPTSRHRRRFPLRPRDSLRLNPAGDHRALPPKPYQPQSTTQTNPLPLRYHHNPRRDFPFRATPPDRPRSGLLNLRSPPQPPYNYDNYDSNDDHNPTPPATASSGPKAYRPDACWSLRTWCRRRRMQCPVRRA